ncbi:MAG: S-layer homology domain-containing protein [Clostridiales bacterium]|nr:S-layer homology domain-containing protein [Clostridiales bacterium]
MHTDGGPHNTARAIYATGAHNTVEINGGWVFSSGLTEAIYVSGTYSTVTVNGGWVSATDHFAIEAYNGGTVTINGGFVFAYGDEPLIDKTGAKIDNGAVGAIHFDMIHVNEGVNGNGVIVTWDRKAWAAAPWNEADYTEGYANHLKVYPGDLVDSYAPPEPLKAILPFGLIESLTPLAIDDEGRETPVFPGFTDSPESIDESGQADSEETEASLDAEAEEASPGEEKGLLSAFEGGSSAGMIGADLPGLFPLAEPLNRVYWHDNGPRPNDGIYYNNMGNAGFFPLAEVEVTTTLVKYALYVTNGTGSGSYREGVVVSLLADTPSANKEFDYWRVLNGSGVAILDISASETTMIMPAGAVYIEAMYQDILYTLQVNGGSGSGSYPAGAMVPILANAPDSGREFDQWTSSGEGSFSNAYSSEASFQMPAAGAAVTAQYRDIPLYTFTLQGGSIDGGYKGPYAAGTVITIRAPGMFPAGYAFNGWKIVSGGGVLDNAFSTLARFTMPAADAVVSMDQPAYTGSAIAHSLSVVDGFDRTGTNPYSASVNVNIEAAPAPEGKVFAGWSVVSGRGTIGNPGAVSTQFRMSDTDATVKANYADVEYPIFVEYGLILNEDSPYRFMAAGQFVMGEEVSLQAIEPPTPAGTMRKYEFAGWTVSNGGSVADAALTETTLIMPAGAVVVTAHWAPRYSFMVFSGEIRYPQPDGGVLWGYYKAGEEIEILHTISLPSYVAFGGWASVSGGSFSDATQESMTFTMPDNDAFVLAGYVLKDTPYTLTVIGGKITVEGIPCENPVLVPSGAEVTITYDPASLDSGTFDPVHDHFERWTSYSTEGTGDSNYGSFSAPAAESTTFIMPAQDVTVTAQVGKLYTLELDDNGDGVFANAGLKAPGAQLPLVAINRSAWPDDMAFTGWVANDGFFLNAGLMQTTFSMPAADAKVAATYVRNVHPLYSLNTINCSSDLPGPFTGDSPGIVSVTITADIPPGKAFSHWESAGISAPITSSPSFTFPMPDNNVTVTAVLTDIEYTLTVVNGEDDTIVGTSQHTAGASVPLTAPPPPTDKAFYQWESDNGGSFAYIRASSTAFLMPVGDVTVTATYRVPQPAEEEPLPPSRPSASPASSPVSTAPAAGQAPGSVSHILRTEDHRSFVVGIGGRIFAPDKDMTRAETAGMFYNLLIRKDIETTRRFPDLPNGAWYKQAVDAMASLGLVSGRPDGLFHPNDAITRAEFVAIAVRFTHESLEDRQAEVFTDVPETHWAYESIVTAASYGWIRGVGEGRFDPDRHISRAEVIAMTNRMLLRSPDKAYIDREQELITYTDVPWTHWAFYEIAEASNSHNFEKQEESAEEKWLSLD